MLEFSDGQKKAIACGLTVVAVSAVATFAIALAWCAGKALSLLSPAITPLAVGLFLAMFFKPYYELWLRLVKNPALAVSLMLASILVPLSIVLWHFGAFAASQVGDLVETAPQRAARLKAWFDATFPSASAFADSLGIPYGTWLDGFREDVARLAAGSAKYVSSFLNWLVSLVFFVYYLTRPAITGADCVREMPFLKDDTKKFVAGQIDAFADIVVSFFQRQTLICIVEGAFYGLGFTLAGVRSGFVIGFALGVLNLVPLLGSVICMPIALTLAYFGADGSTAKAVIVAVVWLAGQVLDGYFITPRIQGRKTGLGYTGVIFSFFFWGVVFKSVLGLLLAIPLSAFFVVFWRTLKSRYIRPVV